jgi:hypothetical protein
LGGLFNFWFNINKMAEDISSARETLRARSARNRRRAGQNGTGNMNLQLNDAQPLEPKVEGSFDIFFYYS